MHATDPPRLHQQHSARQPPHAHEGRHEPALQPQTSMHLCPWQSAGAPTATHSAAQTCSTQHRAGGVPGGSCLVLTEYREAALRHIMSQK